MAKVELPSISMTPPSPLSIPRILRDAIQLLRGYEKLFVQATLFILAPFYLSVFLHQLVVCPLIRKVGDQYKGLNSVDQKEAVLLLVGVEIPFLSAFYFFFLVLMSATILISAASYSCKSTCLEELLLTMGSSWKRVAFTWMLVASLSISYMGILVLLIWVSANYAGYICCWFMGILAALFYLYLAVFWTVGLVVCVLEEDLQGLKALRKAGKLLKGAKLLGFLLMLMLALLTIPIYIMFYITLTDDEDELSGIAQFAFGFFMASLCCVAELFIFVVFTVFYFNCKQSHGERLQVEFEVKYSSVAGHVDSTAIP